MEGLKGILKIKNKHTATANHKSHVIPEIYCMNNVNSADIVNTATLVTKLLSPKLHKYSALLHINPRNTLYVQF
jgi:hypothetical protein